MILGRSLSGRLLVVTIVTVMVMEVLIFVPSVARFRTDYLDERLRNAQLASLAILATPEGMLDPALKTELLERAGVDTIVLRRDGARELVLGATDPPPIEATFDLRAPDALSLMRDGVMCLASRHSTYIRVIGRPDPDDSDEVEVTFDDGPLKAAVLEYGERILALSLVISLATALLIYVLLQCMLVMPMKRLVANMAAFREDPEDLARVIRPRSGVSEIAAAEVALSGLQTQVRDALRARARLAALGEAVAKISHDLRNMLSSTQLMADRIETSSDPLVRRIGPKLLASLDRAVNLCESTLRFGRAEEAAPEPRRIALRALVMEVGESVFPDQDGHSQVVCENRVPEGLIALADSDQLFRVLVNLVRNARQAFDASGRQGVIEIAARKTELGVEIDVRDNGPGLPNRALENLFQPFKGGARKGGAGLGLAIAHELVALQGGRLELVSSTTEGTLFRLHLPG